MTLSVLYPPRDVPFETVTVSTKKVACDGINKDSGHPRVYLNMGADDFVDCPYCSCRYVYQAPPKKLPPKVSIGLPKKQKVKSVKKTAKKAVKKQAKKPKVKAVKKRSKKK